MTSFGPARGQAWRYLVAPVVGFLIAASPAASVAATMAGGAQVPRVGSDAGSQVTADQVAAQQAKAARLAAAAAAQEQQVQAAQAALAQLSIQASAALQAAHDADVARRQAVLTEATERARLDAATAAVEAGRAVLGRWVAQEYRDGNSLVPYALLLDALRAPSTDDVGREVAMLGQISMAKAHALTAVQKAQAAQALAAAKAEAARLRAEQSAAAAEAARSQAAGLVQAQQAQIASLQALLVATQSAAAAAGTQADRLAARRAAEQNRLAALARAAAHGVNRVTGQVGDCHGADVSPYANGQIPLSALCPVDGAPGQYLRADAAYAFHLLAQEYLHQFAVMPCVTQAYRPLSDQLTVYALTPERAAVPGTSNHGWGIAVDFCGGVEQFGTPQHVWMQQNAALFGWYHPAWAEPGGATPEPWHWEFGG